MAPYPFLLHSEVALVVALLAPADDVCEPERYSQLLLQRETCEDGLDGHSSPDEPLEPPEHERGVYFTFRQGGRTGLGSDQARCHIPLVKKRGLSKHHFPIRFSDDKTWMVDCRSESADSIDPSTA